MHLEELEILNFCQHRRQLHRFAPGLTAIIGANGSGKSNFLGAIRFALTGVNPNVGDKEANICQLAPPEERSFVRLVFSHGSQRVEVTRHLRPAGSKTRLSGLTAKPIDGDNKVNAAITELLGRDFDTISEMVLVPQEQIFGFLDQIPSKRAIAFQRLFRTEVAKDIHDSLTRFLVSTPPPAMPSASVAECQQRLAESRTSLQGWQQHLAGLRELAVIQAERDAVVKTIGAYEARRGTATVIANERQSLATLHARLLTVQTQHQQYVASKAAVAADIEGSRTAFDAAKLALSNLANYRKIEQARQAIREGRDKDQLALSQLQEPLRPEGYLDRVARDAALHAAQTALAECRAGLGSLTLQQAQDAVQKMEVELAALVLPAPPAGYLPVGERERAVNAAEQALATANDFLRIFDSGQVAECPTCGTPTQNLADKVAHTRSELPRLLESVSQATALRSACDQYDNDLSGYRNRREVLEQHVPVWQKQIEKLGRLPTLTAAFEQTKTLVDASATYDTAVVVFGNRRTQLQQALQQWDQQESQLQTIEQPGATSEEELQRLVTSQAEREKAAQDFERLIQHEAQERSRLEGQIVQLQAAIASRESSLQTLADVSEEQHALAQQRRTTFDTELQTRQAADTSLATAQQAVTYWENALSQTLAAVVVAEIDNAARERLKGVADLFHHSNLPRFVAHRNLQRLQLGINRFLDMFQTDFRVVADEGLSYTANFFDQRRQPAERLSGGQKVILALAYRLAVNVMFAENIGLLALDEPTAFLDEHHIRGFEPVLNQLRAFSTARGLQCVMITHERGLAPLFDAVIAL